MITERLETDSITYARSEIEKYGLPTTIHFELSIDKAGEIAEKLGADTRLARIGAALMDIKLGQAFKEGRLSEHVKMGVEATRAFLGDYQELTEEEIAKIINPVEAHHGAVPFNCIESEIATNADCYRFMHPTGVLHYIGTLSKRGLEFDNIVSQAEDKLDEKQEILSLDICKQELLPFYEDFKRMFAAARIDG